MKFQEKIYLFIACVFMFALLIAGPLSSDTVVVPTFVANDPINNTDNFDKFLYIVHSQEEIENISNSDKTSGLVDLADFCLFDNATSNIMGNYTTIGIPYDIATDMELEALFSSGVKIYVYGELTINDYEQILNEPLIAARVVVDREDNIISQKNVTLIDDGMQYSVIGWTTMSISDKGLLCSIDNGEKLLEPYHYYKAISDSYLNSQTKPEFYSFELVDERVDNVSYYAGGETHLDWYLRKDLGEVSADRDYYCIETHTWAKGMDGGSEITSVNVTTLIISEKP